MSRAVLDSATLDVPTPASATREPLATYWFAFGNKSKQAQMPELPGDWLNRASRLSHMPAARKSLMILLARAPDKLRSLSEDEARVLGAIIGNARIEGLNTLVSVFKDVDDPPGPAWSSSLFSGLVSKWPEALSSAAKLDKLTILPIMIAVDQSLNVMRDYVSIAARAFAILIRRGEVRAFRSLERIALQPSANQESYVRLLCESGLEAVLNLVVDRDIQDAVDVAVGMVDVGLKTGHHEIINEVLDKVDTETVPPEVALAFLTTSKPAVGDLPARTELVRRFERSIRGRRRPDADALMRFAI